MRMRGRRYFFMDEEERMVVMEDNFSMGFGKHFSLPLCLKEARLAKML